MRVHINFTVLNIGNYYTFKMIIVEEDLQVAWLWTPNWETGRLKCSDRPDRSPSAERRASSRASRPLLRG